MPMLLGGALAGCFTLDPKVLGSIPGLATTGSVYGHMALETPLPLSTQQYTWVPGWAEKAIFVEGIVPMHLNR